MSGNGFDLCECIWTHEMAMRRLLSLLRQSQAYCTDSVCLEELPGGPPSAQGGPSSIFLMTVCWIAVALVLYILRPSSLRSTDDSKPHGNGFGSHGSPPAPPPAIN
ncbi:small integral membrane protein 14 isoform X2 [Cryptotermes secundus]|uniref:small integral membrane protein 14 isoform X2 n=1 Tax=Cryptotermes secundus TaxID=105785 RepID=UPI000CD7D31C|nr:small integral membrane protein 14 isoform X2 [Cryptotermes secundus]